MRLPRSTCTGKCICTHPAVQSVGSQPVDGTQHVTRSSSSGTKVQNRITA
jgi:hypothetical protein